MDQIDQLEREIAQREQDDATRRMAHAVWVYFHAPMDEGFAPTDALELTLSWQMLVMTRGEGEGRWRRQGTGTGATTPNSGGPGAPIRWRC